MTYEEIKKLNNKTVIELAKNFYPTTEENTLIGAIISGLIMEMCNIDCQQNLVIIEHDGKFYSYRGEGIETNLLKAFLLYTYNLETTIGGSFLGKTDEMLLDA